MHLATPFTSITSFLSSWLSSPVLLLIGIAIVGSWVHGWTRNRRRELDIIENALKNGQLSPQTEAELLRRLRPNTGKRGLFSLGWFAIFGAGTYLFFNPHGTDFTIAVGTLVMGFACVTLPLALRELDARRA